MGAEAATIQVEEWEGGKDGTTGSFLEAATDEAELIEKENSEDPNDDVTFVIL